MVLALCVTKAPPSLPDCPSVALFRQQWTLAGVPVEDSLELVVDSHQRQEVAVHSQETALKRLHRKADAGMPLAEFAVDTFHILRREQDTIHQLAVDPPAPNWRHLQSHMLDLRMRASFDLQQLRLVGRLALETYVLHILVARHRTALVVVGMGPGQVAHSQGVE